MSAYHTEKMLIITKTYPVPSHSHREISCVAAINQAGQMRRLFPIPFRLLDGGQQFTRWEWIEARVTKAQNDHRPESYKVDTDSIKKLEKMDTRHGWAERLAWIQPHFATSLDTLEQRRQETGETLGFIRPIDFHLEITKVEPSEWTDEEKAKLIQDGLFDTDQIKNRILLRKLPFDFHYVYTCPLNNEIHTYRHKITDWEIGALFFNCFRSHGPAWEKYFRERIEIEFSETKEIAFLMGTIHRWPDQWLIVGLIYPPKAEARQQAFLFPPSG